MAVTAVRRLGLEPIKRQVVGGRERRRAQSAIEEKSLSAMHRGSPTPRRTQIDGEGALVVEREGR